MAAKTVGSHRPIGIGRGKALLIVPVAMPVVLVTNLFLSGPAHALTGLVFVALFVVHVAGHWHVPHRRLQLVLLAGVASLFVSGVLAWAGVDAAGTWHALSATVVVVAAAVHAWGRRRTLLPAWH